MMRQLSILAVLLCVASCRSVGTSSQPATPAPAPQTAPPAAQPPAAAPGAGNAAAAAPVDTNPERNPLVQQLLRTIAGHEQEPAGQVFKNVQTLKNMPAAAFVRTMGGFARALGGRCSTCHVTGDWPKDDKPQKLVARQMIQMVDVINTRIKGIQGLRGTDPHVGCNSCHRGMAQPAP